MRPMAPRPAPTLSAAPVTTEGGLLLVLVGATGVLVALEVMTVVPDKTVVGGKVMTVVLEVVLRKIPVVLAGGGTTVVRGGGVW